MSVTTYFKDLQNNRFHDMSMAQDTSVAQDDLQSQDTLAMYEARVDVKKLSQLFQGQFNPTKVICSKE